MLEFAYKTDGYSEIYDSIEVARISLSFFQIISQNDKYKTINKYISKIADNYLKQSKKVFCNSAIDKYDKSTDKRKKFRFKPYSIIFSATPYSEKNNILTIIFSIEQKENGKTLKKVEFSRNFDIKRRIFIIYPLKNKSF